ncbi:hypothetical protein [Dyella tabacisoli]|uniref:Uncharacterized protein n=1 Tax=Dyella tabacisoli TaxID=2282381 RepID=A0A369UM42_9GAMM|nr:hypothetical protein [Dyella tabacisoli]RDD81413.1 hypothetical protein DVJ77_11915 [Dyella tabacisoli]
MPTDRITPSSSLIETMRALARDRAKGPGQNNQVADAGSSPRHQAPPSATDKVSELRQRLRSLIADVDVADTQSLTHAREPVLREILLWEFGSDFRQDSQFLLMVTAIGKAFDADPGFQQRFAELVAGLQKK